MWPSQEKITWLLVYSLLTGYLLVLASCKQPVPEPSVPLSADQASLVQALNQVSLPLTGADPERAFTDLTPLDSLFSQTQVVGMGEATHGTREFFQMKARLFRYLVERHGFRTLAFEASFGSCVLVNRYIHGQPTSFRTTAEAVKRMGFWTWSTTEVRDLIEWMKQYNTGKPATEQLSFYGVDCQLPEDDYLLINEFVAKVDIDASYTLPAIYHNLTRIGEIYDLFVANEAKWVAGGGRPDYELAKQAARMLVQQQDVDTRGSCQRDRYMAENTQWLLTTLGVAKVSLWAHDYHVGNWQGGCSQGGVMGAYLKKQLNDKYLIIGTSLSNGSFNAINATGTRSLRAFSVQSQSAPTSFNYLLDRAQYPVFALKLNQPSLPASLRTWLTSEYPLFEPGALYDESKPDFYYSPSRLAGRFDVLIHFRNTTPTQLLP